MNDPCSYGIEVARNDVEMVLECRMGCGELVERIAIQWVMGTLSGPSDEWLSRLSNDGARRVVMGQESFVVYS